MNELLADLGGGAHGVGLLDALRGVLAAFVFGQILAFAHERTFDGVSHSRGLTHTVVLVSVAASAFVMAIGRSLYAGLGLLGVLSIIRFRANLKAPRDLAFLLGAATAGVASGIDALPVAFAGTLAFAGVALYLHHGPFGSRRRFDGILRFRLQSTKAAEGPIRKLLETHTRAAALLSVGEVAQGEEVEHTYQVRFGKDDDRDALLSALRQDFGARDARVLLQHMNLEY